MYFSLCYLFHNNYGTRIITVYMALDKTTTEKLFALFHPTYLHVELKIDMFINDILKVNCMCS